MVLSLFGIIPELKIKELVSTCERFMISFLEDRIDKKENDYDIQSD